LNIRYAAFNSDEITNRNIEPIGIFYSNGYWHAIAFCQLRTDYRDFRTDRILQLFSTDKTFDKEHPSLKTYLEQRIEKRELQTIVINVSTYAAKYLGAQKYYYGFLKEDKIGDCVQMTFLTPYDDYFERWLITFADHAEVVTPESLKTKLKEFVYRIQQKIS